jgi:thioredoxin-like negative regulator of GroEL
MLQSTRRERAIEGYCKVLQENREARQEGSGQQIMGIVTHLRQTDKLALERRGSGQRNGLHRFRRKGHHYLSIKVR